MQTAILNLTASIASKTGTVQERSRSVAQLIVVGSAEILMSVVMVQPVLTVMVQALVSEASNVVLFAVRTRTVISNQTASFALITPAVSLAMPTARVIMIAMPLLLVVVYVATVSVLLELNVARAVSMTEIVPQLVHAQLVWMMFAPQCLSSVELTAAAMLSVVTPVAPPAQTANAVRPLVDQCVPQTWNAGMQVGVTNVFLANVPLPSVALCVLLALTVPNLQDAGCA